MSDRPKAPRWQYDPTPEDRQLIEDLDRAMDGLPDSSTFRDEAWLKRQVDAAELMLDNSPADAGSSASTRKSGRPKGRTHDREALVRRFRELREEKDGKRPTQEELAANLIPPIGRTALKDSLRDAELPWPIE